MTSKMFQDIVGIITTSKLGIFKTFQGGRLFQPPSCQIGLRKTLLKIFSRIKKYTVFFYMTSFALVLCMMMGKEGLWFDELILILSVIQCSALFPMRLDNVTFVGKCLSFSYWWMLYTLLPNDPIGQLKGLFTLFF